MVGERKTPFEIAAEKEQQRAALRAIRQHKENIQSSASNLVALYLVGLNVTQKEKARLYQPFLETRSLIETDAPVYHRAMPLERKLKHTKNRDLRRYALEIARERNKLQRVMDMNFPRLRPADEDLSRVLVMGFAAALLISFVAMPAWLVVLLIIPPVFFAVRKIVRACTKPAFDFTLETYNVTRSEYDKSLESEDGSAPNISRGPLFAQENAPSAASQQRGGYSPKQFTQSSSGDSSSAHTEEPTASKQPPG